MSHQEGAETSGGRQRVRCRLASCDSSATPPDASAGAEPAGRGVCRAPRINQGLPWGSAGPGGETGRGWRRCSRRAPRAEFPPRPPLNVS